MIRSHNRADMSLPTTCTKERRIDVTVMCWLMSLYLFFLPANPLSSPDEEILLRTVISFLEGDRGAIAPLPGGFATRTGLDGREYAQYGPGLPVTSAPFLAISYSICKLTCPGTQNAPTAKRSFRLWAVSFNLAITAASAIVLRRLLGRLGFTHRLSVSAAMLFGIATVAWPHGRTFFTEPLASLCLLLAIERLYQPNQASRDKPKNLLLAGVCFGWAVLTRLDSLVAAPALACAAARKVGICSRLVRRWSIIALPVIVTLGLIAGHNYWRFGAIGRTGYEDQAEGVRFSTPFLVGLHGYLLTPGRSLFVYSPVLLLAVPGVVRLWQRDRWFTLVSGLVVACYLITMSKWQNWAGGWDWGPRHIYQVTPWLAIWAAAWLTDQNSVPRWSILLLFVSLAVQLLGLLTDPVQVIRDARLDMIALQLSVYDPSRCTIVLHTRWLMNHSPNLLVVELAKTGSSWLIAFGLPLLGLGLCTRILVLWFQGKRYAEHPHSPL